MGFYLKSFKVIFLVFIVTMSIIHEGHCQHLSQFQDFEKLLNQAIKNKDNVKASFYSAELAKLYVSENQDEKAADYFLQCVSYGRKGQDHVLMYVAYQQLGMIFTRQKNYTKAINNFEKALSFAEASKKQNLIMEGLIQIAITHDQLGRPKKSIEPLEKALALSLEQNDLTTQQKCYELLADLHAKTGNLTKSREYKNLYTFIIQSKQKDEQSIRQKKTLDLQIKKANDEKKLANNKLKKEEEKLKHAEDSLVVTKSSLREATDSLQETAQSLQQTKELSEKRQLQIDLLNKNKELADLYIKEQNAQLRNEALIRNSIIIVLILASALVSALIIGYRKKVKANKKIAEQNKSIRSSINYAKRIQEAMLPKTDLQKKLMPDSFVLYKPRDSVSGDFYLFTEVKNWYSPDVVFAAADCTGHGVPGAFMSLIGMNVLSAIIGKGIADPDQLLNELNMEIQTALQQETSGNNDGMDVALCIYRKEKNVLEFSGAKSPLIYIQNNKLVQIKGDVHSIGGSRSKKKFQFKKHVITIDQPTTVYLFTDGYRDQFGGKSDTKFMSKRFADLLLEIHTRPLSDQKEILNKTIEEWKGAYSQTDDILVLGMRLDVNHDLV